MHHPETVVSLQVASPQEELSEQRLAVEMSQKRKIRALSPATESEELIYPLVNVYITMENHNV
jgi:hypothetical protein